MERGYIAMVTVLIVSAVVMTTVLTVTFLSIGEAQSGLALFKGEDTLNFVEGCVEDALIKARNNSSYAGGNITRPEGACVVTINSKVGATWNITITTSDTLYKRSIQVIFDRLSSGISLTSWKEI